MADLSPAALAVRDAAERQTDLDFRYAPMIAAAALVAAADQVVPEETWLGTDETCYAYYRQRCNTRHRLLAIAAELRGQGDSND
jgi:hypothetical protein